MISGAWRQRRSDLWWDLSLLPLPKYGGFLGASPYDGHASLTSPARQPGGGLDASRFLPVAIENSIVAATRKREPRRWAADAALFPSAASSNRSSRDAFSLRR